MSQFLSQEKYIKLLVEEFYKEGDLDGVVYHVFDDGSLLH